MHYRPLHPEGFPFQSFKRQTLPCLMLYSLLNIQSLSCQSINLNPAFMKLIRFYFMPGFKTILLQLCMHGLIDMCDTRASTSCDLLW